MRHELVQVLREGVIVVTGCLLRGLTESSAIISNDTVTRSQKHCGLLLPGSAAQRITVDQNDRLTRAVVLIIEIDVAGVFLSDSNVWHKLLLCGSECLDARQSP